MSPNVLTTLIDSAKLFCVQIYFRILFLFSIITCHGQVVYIYLEINVLFKTHTRKTRNYCHFLFEKKNANTTCDIEGTQKN